MDISEKRSRGEKMFREITMMEPPQGDDVFMEFSLEELFGNVWSRPGLTRKERRWISLATAAMTGSPVAIKSHVNFALQSGDITPEEMIEFVVHFAHYGGWPLASVLHMEVRTAIAALQSTDSK